MKRPLATLALFALLAGLASTAAAQAPAAAPAPIKIRFAWQPYNAVLFYTARDGDNVMKSQLHRVGADQRRGGVHE